MGADVTCAKCKQLVVGYYAEIEEKAFGFHRYTTIFCSDCLGRIAIDDLRMGHYPLADLTGAK